MTKFEDQGECESCGGTLCEYDGRCHNVNCEEWSPCSVVDSWNKD